MSQDSLVLKPEPSMLVFHYNLKAIKGSDMNFQEAMFFSVSSRAAFAYDRYWLHKRQAVLQFDRLQTAIHEHQLFTERLPDVNLQNREASQLWGKVMITSNQQILAEVHLWFIALDNTLDMIKVILKEEALKHLYPELGDLINKTLHQYTEGRHTFEHYDERIPEGKYHHKVKTRTAEGGNPRTVLGGIKNGAYIFGDQDWALGHDAFQEVVNGLYLFENLLHEQLKALGYHEVL